MDTPPRMAPVGLPLPSYGYDFTSSLVGVLDGDTLRMRLVHVALSGDGDVNKPGPGSRREVHAETFDIRLAGIAAPEKKTSSGQKVLGLLAGYLMQKSVMYRVRLLRGDKYHGREGGIIWCEDGTNIAQWLKINGHAVQWDGKGKQPEIAEIGA